MRAWNVLKSWVRDAFHGETTPEVYKLAERAGQARLIKMRLEEPLPLARVIARINRPSGLKQTLLPFQRAVR